MTNRINPLFSHSKIFFFHEAYYQVVLKYFSLYEISSEQSIKRTPFELLFPTVSPFKEESDSIDYLRHALLRDPIERSGISSLGRRNELARFDIINHLIQHQFYPRYMIPEFVQLFATDFLNYKDRDSALNLFVILLKKEIFHSQDRQCLNGC